MRNNMPRGATIEVLLMEIADGLFSLAKEPDLSDKIKAAYALNDAEKTTLDESRAIIANANSIRIEFETTAQKYSDIEDKITQATNIQNNNQDALVEIDKKTTLYNNKVTEMENNRKDLANFAKSLDAREAELNAREQVIRNQENDIAAQRVSIKDALDKYNIILGGLVQNG